MKPSIINYSIYGNHDRALHAQIHPRYDTEEAEMRGTVPFIYHMNKYPVTPYTEGFVDLALKEVSNLIRHDCWR